MKTTKRFIAMAAALALTTCAAMPMASFAAANTINITENSSDTATHAYKAIKIFSGTAGASGLTGLDWADATIKSKVIAGYNQVMSDGLATTAPAIDVAAALNSLSPENLQLVAKAITNQSGLPAGTTITSGVANSLTDGYYLILDTATPPANGESYSTSFPMLKVYDASEGLDISTKGTFPTVEKKIQENEKTGAWSGDTYGAKYNDTADFCIGDTVPFEIIGTVPDAATLGYYDNYKYVFHDTLGEEFTLVTADASATINDFTITIGNKTITSGFTLETSTDTDGNTIITLTCANLKAVQDSEGTLSISDLANKKVKVTYNAILNENAVIGRNGQTNEVYLEYSNNPSHSGTGNENDTGNSAKDKVVAFTYELDVSKIDATTKDALNGAKFALYKKVNDVDYYAKVDNNNKILDWIPGSYTANTETFTKSAEDNLNGTANTTPTLTSGSSFSFVGLDDGEYYLKEVTAPDHYNKLASDVKVEIVADTSNGQNEDADGTELTKLELIIDDTSTLVYDASVGDDNTTQDVNEAAVNSAGLTAGVLAFSVENTSNSALPSTGGMGTTLFILGGGCAAGLAGIYLVSKKRAKEDAE